MSTFMLEHIKNNVWCDPRQDGQLRLKLALISPETGEIGFSRHLLQNLTLPDSNSRFWLYAIGRSNLHLFQVRLNRHTWYSLDRIANEHSNLIELYNGLGIHFPLNEAFIAKLNNDSYVIAVKQPNYIAAPIAARPLYIRFYSSAFFNSTEYPERPKLVKVLAKRIMNNQDKMVINSFIQQYASTPGYTYGYVNGVFYDRLNASYYDVGDQVDVIFDSSIFQVIRKRLTSLPTFFSELDTSNKFLYRGDQLTGSNIYYNDDIDVFMTKVHNGAYVGRMFPKHNWGSMRNLTHKDFSLSTTEVNGVVNDTTFFPNRNGIDVFLIIRHSSTARNLVLERMRINELYKLPNSTITNAMIATGNNASPWKASDLEKSFYAEAMRDLDGFFDRETVEQVYGYHGVSYYTGNTPSNVVQGQSQRYVDVPDAAYVTGTVYEYNQYGKLNHVALTTNSSRYYPNKTDTTFCEILGGRVDNSLHLEIDRVVGSYNEQDDMGFYYCEKVAGTPTGEYRKAGPDEVSFTDGQYSWMLAPSMYRLIVQRDRNILGWTKQIPIQDGELSFTVTSNETIAGTTREREVVIPTKKLDIWLNKNPLVPGIDFVVVWPKVFILSKRFLRAGLEQEVTIRAYGLVDDDLKYKYPTNRGFVDYGVLSRNNYYDIYDGKVISIIVGGGVRQRSDISVSEDRQALQVNHAYNGLPFCISETLVPIKPYIKNSPRDLHLEDHEIDEKVSAYLGFRITDEVPQVPSMQQEPYVLVSPFLSKIISELRSGSIEQAFVYSRPSTHDITERLAIYEYLLEFDLTQDENGYQEHYMFFVPSYGSGPVDLNPFEAEFVRKVIKHYLYDRVNFPTNFRIV